MAMNIKSTEANRLARELSTLTGESITAAITEALRERLSRLKKETRPGLAERLLAIGRDCAPRLREPYRSGDPADLLYDGRGLPK
jgi:antitoxin VapB